MPHQEIINLVFSQFNRTITFKTIARIWEKYTITQGVADRKRSGRPKVFTQREERDLVRDFLAHPGVSIKHTTKERQRAGKPGCKRTIRKLLRGKGLVPKVSERGKEIAERNKKLRVKFAQRHTNWTINDWRRVVFSDEATLYPKRSQTCVRWIRAGTPSAPPLEDNLRTKSINVWCYINYDGTGEIFRFQGTMRKESYRDMLEDHMLDALEDPHQPGKRLIFMQDGASYHTSGYVINWLRQKKVNYLSWPAQNPDLNPVENVWATIREELFKRRDKIKNNSDLWAQTRDIFHSLTLVYIRSLYHSMPERLESIIKSNGNRINY